ncbi:btk-binding protein-related [Anaeramoeba ignava]|uniref:Btk-binding protein-related n=1 Tax=Anaeramoeba ignava TaxID=1746090 RepID=A0A9Q0LA05_ANAIG|nr:btk-binding protein-related [Anaeramoeba ignava]
MNDCLFFGRNQNPKLIKNEKDEITKPIQFKFENENENENENEKQIKQISSSYFSTIFLFENGKAIEYLKDLNQNPEKIQIENIQKVTAAFVKGVILTKEGNVFAKGINIDLQNANNTKEFINISSLIEDTNDRIIQDIVSGWNSTYLLTSNQNAYGIGSNRFGQLGFDSETLKKTEKPILMMKNVSKIFSGISSNSVFLLNSNQELFGCGYNESGQIGLGKSRKYEAYIQKLTKIQNIPKGKIIDIKSSDHSIMLIENEDENEDENENENPKRKLYSCGSRHYNGLGKNKDTYEFTEIKSSLLKNDDIIDISVGNDHSLILTSKSKLIVFGDNYYGQLGTGNLKYQLIPIQIKLPKLRFNENISNYHVYCGYLNSFLYCSPPFSNLEEDLIKLFRRKEFCDISFKTKNGEIIEVHKLILKYRLNQNQNEIEKLKEIISKKSIKESNQIFEMIYSNNSKINPILYSEIKEIINSNEKIEEIMKRIYLNENEKDFIIERKEKKYKFPKLILIMRSELYRGMFLSVTNDTSNKVTDYSELSNKSFQIFEYWIYSNQIKNGIQITKEIIQEIKRGIDYFQLNQTNPNLFDLLINKFKNQNQKKRKLKFECF